MPKDDTNLTTDGEKRVPGNKKKLVRHQAHNNLFTSIFSNPESAKVLMKLALKQSQIKYFDLDKLQMESNTLTSPRDLKGKYSDLLFTDALKSNSNIRIHILIEHKSLYDTSVMKQLLEYIQRLHEGEAIAVMPIIIYHGKPRWKRKKSFSGVEYKELSQEFLQVLKGPFVDFEPIFVDLGDKNTFNLLDLMPVREQYVLKSMAGERRNTVEDLASYITRLRELKLTKLTGYLLFYFEKTLSKAKMNRLIQIIEERHRGDEVMENILQENDFYRLTMKSERENSLAEGLELGRTENAHETATLLIRDNFSDDEIQKYTKLSLDEIAKMRDQVQD